MKKLVLSIVACGLLASSLWAQAPPGQTLSGYVESGATGERLIGANVYDLDRQLGASTNSFGFFSYSYPGDTLRLRISYVGYQPLDTVLTGQAPRDFVARLSDVSELTAAVVTASEQSEAIDEQVQMSRVDVPFEQIKRAPSLLGETDVLKTLQLLPGVQAGSEGTAGIYVRGGSPDQNLVLLDGVPVYNVSHVLGIFSVFNADAINNISLTKGGFPARYGGRLSSVLEINMKDRHRDAWHGEGGIGLISSRLTVGGPLGKKTRVLLSGRRTYADLIAKPLIAYGNKQDANTNISAFNLNFYDLNTKVRHDINDRHRIYLSGYLGGDVFGLGIEENYNSSNRTERYETDAGIRWGNAIAALRWNWEINPKTFSNLTATLSNYQIKFYANLLEEYEKETFTSNALYRSGIRDVSLRYDVDYLPNPKHTVRTGLQLTHHRYLPGAVQVKNVVDGAGIDTLLGQDATYGLEGALYLEDEWRINQRLSANVGLHLSGFKQLQDSVSGKLYTSLQPRLALRYRAANGLAYKASFATMTQFINLLTSEALSLPTDLWVPTTNRVKPQRSWQAAAGVAKVFGGKYELSAEAFYKEMRNVVSYKPGASFFDFNLTEKNWEDEVTQGDGRAYGLELFAQKKIGRTTGWVGYTLSWNTRQFAEINGGKRFPFRYDRRHDLSILVSHEFTKKIRGSAAFIFGTGNAVTLPSYKYTTAFYTYGNLIEYHEGREVEQAAERNGYRMSPTHRLDLSVEFHKKKRWGERAWVVGLYNAYWNRNPYFVQLRSKFNDSGVAVGEEFVEYSILPVIPSVSYKFSF